MRSTAPLGRWGDLDHDRRGLSERTRAFVESHLGPPSPAPVPQTPVLPDPLLSASDLAALFPGLDADPSPQARAGLARGMSYLDLLAWRSSAPLADLPDAVLRPRDHEQAAAILRTCSREGIVAVAVGGGTSVTGGITPTGVDRPVVVVSTERLDGVDDMDEVSGIATVHAGITGPQLAQALPAWTLGHFPQSWQRASIGGFIAARSSGQASGGYGRIEDMLIGATVATPVGAWQVGGFPAASIGPDLRHLILGSEGTLGVITRAQLRLRPAPSVVDFAAAMIPGGFDAGAAVVRELTRSLLRPSILRLSDPSESAAMLAMSGPGGLVGSAFDSYLRVRGAADGCLLILGWEATREEQVQQARSFAFELLADAGAVRLGAAPGRAWAKGRFHGPYFRDELLDLGYLVETFETVTSWANLPSVHRTVSAAAKQLLGEHSYVMAHISHSYDTGASLYFTVLAGGWSDPDECAVRWRGIKERITDVIVDEHAAVSHHHGVGRDHAPWLERHIGAVGVDVLRAVKQTVDPANVLNPGAVIGPAS